jgi:hypothetical protein
MEVLIMPDKQEGTSQHEVRIHIDREPYESPDPTTGAALYVLGKIAANRELFREVDGDLEDELVPNDNTPVRLKKDEHFYSQRDFHIIVNARPKVVTERFLSFAQIVALAFDNPPTGPNIMFTITYRNGPPKNAEGSLLEGQSVKIKDKMVFNVTPTDKS